MSRCRYAAAAANTRSRGAKSKAPVWTFVAIEPSKAQIRTNEFGASDEELVQLGVGRHGAASRVGPPVRGQLIGVDADEAIGLSVQRQVPVAFSDGALPLPGAGAASVFGGPDVDADLSPMIERVRREVTT